MQARIKTLLVVVLAALVSLSAFAAATDQAEKVAAKMLDFQEALEATNTQIDTTLKSMNSLSTQDGDLVAKYKSFTKEVSKLEKMGEKAKSNSATAAKERDAYLAKWKSSQEKIQNPELKAASEARRAELAPKIDAIKDSLSTARESFTPFMQDLKDLTIFLGNDLSPSAISSASGMFTKCNDSGGRLKASIADGAAAVSALGASVQPGGAKK